MAADDLGNPLGKNRGKPTRRFLPSQVLPVAGGMLALLLAAQVFDSQTEWSSFRRAIPAPAATWTTPLASPFWDRAAAAGYTRVRAIPVVFHNADWRALETYAYAHGMDIDAIYLGRVDLNAVAALNAHEKDAVATGGLEPHTLYLLDLAAVRALAPRLAPDDLLAEIDGRLVFAKAGARLVDGLGIAPHSALAASPWLPSNLQFFVGL